MKLLFQWQDGDSDNSFLSDYLGKVFDDGMLLLGTNLGSAGEYGDEGSRFVGEAPELFEELNENILNQHNLQFNTSLNPSVPAQQLFLQPSIWEVPECTENGYWSLDTNVCVYAFPFPRNLLTFHVS